MEVVSQAGSVAGGRERMAQGGIDAAIVDIPLPEEGAASMVGDLHEADPSVPAVVMAAIEDERVHERFVGADESLRRHLLARVEGGQAAPRHRPQPYSRILTAWKAESPEARILA